MKNIPKIYHLMWDRSAISWLQVQTLTSFHRLNPDWRIIVYVPEQSVSQLGINTYVPDYTAKDYFYLIEAMNFVEIQEVDLKDYRIRTDAHFILCSDQLRYIKLYEMGGLYSDFDVLWLKPIDSLLSIDVLGDPTDFESTVCYHKDTHEWSNIAVHISEPKSPYLAELIREQKQIKPPYRHQVFGTDLIDKLYPRFDLIKAAYPRILGVKYKTWYPFDINNLKTLYVDTDISPVFDKDVMCIHWFNGHRLSKDYINQDTYDQPCAMTTILTKLNYTK
jgi:hypothetical protein